MSRDDGLSDVLKMLRAPGFVPDAVEPLRSTFDDMASILLGLSYISRAVSSRAARKIAVSSRTMAIREYPHEAISLGAEACAKASAALMTKAGMSKKSAIDYIAVEWQKGAIKWGAKSVWQRLDAMTGFASTMMTALVSDRDRRGDLVDAASKVAALAIFWMREIEKKESRRQWQPVAEPKSKRRLDVVEMRIDRIRQVVMPGAPLITFEKIQQKGDGNGN